jgi:hypothetical protein
MTTPLPLPPSSPMSFSDAIKKAKVADAATAEAEKVRDEGGQQAQATALQPSKTQHAVPQRDNENGSDTHAAAGRRAEEDEDKDEDAEAELPMHGLFDFEDYDIGAARAGIIDPFDAVGLLRNLCARR